ncbi:hypothetical protein CBS101457_000103 [Exobasidium rhododendri]|nr:hypothetical protein CBS101457_000103 [Exobasidium rhododendri]
MTAFQKFIDDKVKAGLALGLSAVVFDGDHEIFSGTSGVHTVAGDGTSEQPMRPETVHWVASCTKLSVSLIVLQILEKGLAKGLSLDSLDDNEALVSILPEFKIGSGSIVTKILEGYGPIGADGKRELIMRDAKVKVTLRHLLTHSAGLAYYWNDDLMVQYYEPSEGEAHAASPFATGEISDFACPAVREAGEQMDYSPVTDWLGQFAVRATGKNLRQLFLDMITRPLNIPNTECDMRIKDMAGADFAGMHVRGPGGSDGPDFIQIPFGVYQPEDDDPPPGKAYFASAGVYSSVRAYCKVLQACLAHDERLLKESSWKTVTKDAWNGKLKMPNPLWKSGRPDLTYDIGEFSPSTVKDHGWSMNLLQNHVALAPTLSGRPTGSYSWAGLGNTYYFIDPVNGVGAMISTQLLPFADPKLMEMKNEWEALIYSQVEKKP